jgi:hypothetical protein
MLPWILLIGVPTILCIIIAWKDILQLLNRLDELYGSWFWGIILVFGATIAFLNIVVGFILTLEKISEKLNRKWFYAYIIITAFGIFALTEVLL